VNQIGETVANNNVNIVDDARLLGGLGSSPFDGEGVATGKTLVVENGVLRNYLHSAYTGRKLGARPTGNGMRTAAGTISVGPTNFYLKPGDASPEDIIGSVRNGLYVVELIGFGVNTVNGEYSRGVTGIWIEDGRLTYPVQEVTIAGNLREMLREIELIGTDLAFMSTVAAPTIKIRKMTVSGE
jgi:PmbA protein